MEKSATQGTEGYDPRFSTIELMEPFNRLSMHLNAEIAALRAMEPVLPAIAAAVDAATERLRGLKGRIIIIGAGTSGRIGIQDLTELISTFGWDRIAFAIAGGKDAVFAPAEGAEDNAAQAIADVEALNIGPDDVVIAMAASGRTPYTIAGIKAARAAGALTIAMANNPDSALEAAAEHGICIPVGPQLIAGSTRMSAGTTQKLFMNMMTTHIMIGLHRVFMGMMVDVIATCEKVEKRAVKIVGRGAACDEAQAREALERAEGWVKSAILIAMGVPKEDAVAALNSREGDLHGALAAFGRQAPAP